MPNRTCPVCGGPASSLGAWLRGRTVLRTDCRSCGAKLKGCVVAKTGLAVLLIAAVGVIAVAASTMPTGASTPAYRYREIFPPALLCGAILFLLGGYVPAAGTRPQQEAGGTPPAAVRSWRVAVVAGLALALVAWTLATARRDLILLLGKFSTSGFVTKVRQPAPGPLGASALLVSYDYFDPSGAVRSGRDRLPRSTPQPEIGPIEVVYSTLDPSVSRLASQVRRWPAYVLMLGAAALFCAAAQLARNRRLRRLWRQQPATGLSP